MFQAKSFMREFGLDGKAEMFVDPDPAAAAAYDAFRLSAGRETLFPEDVRLGVGPLGVRPEVARAAARAAAAGFERDGPPDQADGTWSPALATRVGGVFVLGPGNCCDYAFRSSFAGDHPDLNEVTSRSLARAGLNVG